MAGVDLNDTIAAIATPLGESGIGIVRLSGKDSLGIADKIFVSGDGRKPSDFKTYTTHYGWITGGKRQDIIDEVILTVMRGPKSYTREDVVEINCHGGMAALRAVLDLVLGQGARLAGPGEFTQRAFLNGRIDLAQAEAVLDIIRAKTDAALKVGLRQLQGGLSREINRIRAALLGALSIVEANIDFPEEEISGVDPGLLSEKLKKLSHDLCQIIERAHYARTLREGLQVVICGKPNVGKSSLLNALLKEERSIVTSIPGTTRDTIEEIIDIRGIPVMIIDTAGILEPRDLIEKKAIRRTRAYMDNADLIILLFDASRSLNKEDHLLIRKLKPKKVLAVLNKIDLPSKVQRKALEKIFPGIIGISAKKSKGLNLLEEAIVNFVLQGKVVTAESVLATNLRHIQALKRAQNFVAQAQNSLDNSLSFEFVAQEIKDALSGIDGLLGRAFSEDLLERIFSEFCIGK
jgi:tRNA modification GTPase